MKIGYYPHWDSGFVRTYIESLKKDGQRKKAAVRIGKDITKLALYWPNQMNIDVRGLSGYEPLMELKREYQGIQYRIFYCVSEDKIWLLHTTEKKSQKMPERDLKVAYNRMIHVFNEDKAK